MGLSKNFFEDTEKEFIQAILYYVSEHIDIDIENALKLFHIENNSPLEFFNKIVSDNANFTKINNQCRVLLKNGERCSKVIKSNGMCTTHFKQHTKCPISEDNLVDNNKVSKFQLIVNKLHKIRESPLLIDLKLICIQDKEYLIDPLSCKLYDFDTLKNVGKLSKFRQVKLLHTI